MHYSTTCLQHLHKYSTTCTTGYYNTFTTCWCTGTTCLQHLHNSFTISHHAYNYAYNTFTTCWCRCLLHLHNLHIQLTQCHKNMLLNKTTTVLMLTHSHTITNSKMIHRTTYQPRPRDTRIELYIWT